jgi:hypothetical protein
MIPVNVAVGTKSILSKFFVFNPEETLEQCYTGPVSTALLAAEKPVGDFLDVLVKVPNMPIPLSASSLTDKVSTYLNIPAESLTFVVSDIHAERRTVAPIFLQVTGSYTIPEYTGRAGGNQDIFNTMRDIMKEDGCGFKSADYGKKWMMDGMQLLYLLSTFHENLKIRGCSIPGKFAFSCGANDYSAKAERKPMLTQEVIASAISSATALALAPHLTQRTCWSTWDTALHINLEEGWDVCWDHHTHIFTSYK